MTERLIAGALLVVVVVGFCAWQGNSVGGAGFWRNVGWIMAGMARMALGFATVVGLIYLVGVVASGSWSLWY